jgi:signal transduction histidine kinase
VQAEKAIATSTKWGQGNVEFTLSYILAGVLSVGYLAAALVVRRDRAELEGLFRPTFALLLAALAAQWVNTFTFDAHFGPLGFLFLGGLTQPAVAVLLACLFLTLFANLSLHYFQVKLAPVVLVGGLIWCLSLLVASLQTPDKTILLGANGWFGRIFDPYPLGVTVLVGGAVMGLAVGGAGIYRFATAHLSELANGAAFWLAMMVLIFVGVLLGISGTAFAPLGWITQFAGVLGVLYALLSDQVFTVRRLFRFAVFSLLNTVIGTLLLFLALNIARTVETPTPLIVLLIAAGVALLYVPARAAVGLIMDRLFGRPAEDATSIVRDYSQNIAGVVELSELSDRAIDILRRTLRARGGGLLLATRDDNDTIRIEPKLSNLSELPEVRGWIPKNGAVYRRLFEQKLPLLQYDLEFNREFESVPPELRSFFKQLKTGAYAPITISSEVIGVLAATARSNDEPYSPQDLELLATLATTTGVALRNARLVNDLRQARDETQELNSDIVKTKVRLEQLDKVKTDFITVASHELRTPLAQIRGYTDILDALGDQPGGADPDQVTSMTNNLRKATDRLEQLIADMLDVSQIGLDAMDLRFATIGVDNVVRLAIEPLAESINQRKLQLTARGLKNMPPIQGDMQRLVQAFRNVVLNAIKYTPDGGRIEITAQLEQDDASQKDQIHIAIKDTGIGIDSRYLEVIFEKFFRVADPGLHSTGATKFMGAGPGLGLTIARGMIEGHGGRIWAESAGHNAEKLPGTIIHILLPVSPPETAKQIRPLETPSGRIKTPTLGSLTN